MRRPPAGHGFHRIFVAQFAQIEAAGLGNVHRAAHGIGIIGKQPRHLRRWLQVALGIGRQPIAGSVYSAVLANAGQHVSQGAPRRGMHMGIVGRNQRCANRLGNACQDLQPLAIIASINIVTNKIQPALNLFS